ALGAYIDGIKVAERAYAGGPFDWLTPFSLFCGLGLIAAYAMLGCTWLIMKTEGELQERMHQLGKPLTFGHFRGTAVIGLPGNPASTLVTFALLARPYLLRRLGVADVAPLAIEVPVAFTWGKPGNRREYLRGRLENGRAVIYPNQSSGVLRSAAWAEGLVEVLEGRTLAEGDRVRFIPLSELLR
ncbi:cytochrome d ubiquinol oxidase subunit II, partial [Pseudomonas sp.]|uniref:cytochrome d ubiquinol oxidase subunit II n=1 Tax=Pseudomonas sp. TaxID=306 RepID=UPI002583FFCF